MSSNAPDAAAGAAVAATQEKETEEMWDSAGVAVGFSPTVNTTGDCLWLAAKDMSQVLARCVPPNNLAVSLTSLSSNLCEAQSASNPNI